MVAVFFAIIVFNAFYISLPYASEPRARVIDIRLGSYYIKPDKITLKVGEPVIFNLVNEATLIPHNLAIQAPEAGINIKVEVSARKKASVTFTPTKTGTYEMACTKKPLFGKTHKEKGMHGVIEVVP